MISVVAATLLLQLLLISSGLALLQLVNRGGRIQILPLIPFAWGTGVVLLYLVGRLFVEAEWLPNDWHLAVAFGMAVLTVAGAVAWRRAAETDHGEIIPARNFPLSVRIHWYDALIIALIVMKVGVVTYILLVNPAIDADATYMRGYMGLAKKIREGVALSEVMERGIDLGSPIGPSLLSAWPVMFLERWHDNVAVFPWALAWVFGGYAAQVVCYRLSRHLTASLVLAYLFLSVPLAAIHVFQSGFHDLLTAYFFLMSVGAAGIAFLSPKEMNRTWGVIGGIAVLGCMLCKLEGKVWGLLLGVLWLNWYLHAHREIPWKKLILVQLPLVIALILVHRLVLTSELLGALGGRRLAQMAAPAAFDENAFSITLYYLFLDGSFGLWWWTVGLAGVYLLAAKKASENAKMLALFTFSVLLAVVYFANFTENVRFTLNGTNVSRFLLQISGLLIPLYCAVTMTWLPTAEEGNRRNVAASQERNSPAGANKK